MSPAMDAKRKVKPPSFDHVKALGMPHMRAQSSGAISGHNKSEIGVTSEFSPSPLPST